MADTFTQTICKIIRQEIFENALPALKSLLTGNTILVLKKPIIFSRNA